MKRIFYSGITKTLLALLLLFCCTAATHYSFLTLRVPLLYGNADTVCETRQYSELFAKYIERTAVYARYREEGYSLSTSSENAELALLLDGELADRDLEAALYNVYSLNETAFYYYHSKINEAPSNYQYYIVNQKTGAVYASRNFTQYASATSGSVEKFLEEGILNETIYVIVNTGNNRVLTHGGNSDVINRSSLLWSIDFLQRNLSEMEEDTYYDISYTISDEAAEPSSESIKGSVPDADALKNVIKDPDYPFSDPIISQSGPEAPQNGEAPVMPNRGPYLLYAFVANNLVADDFTKLSSNFVRDKSDFAKNLQLTVLFILLSVFLFTICNVLSGRCGNGEIHLHFYDRIFTELILIAFAALFLLPYLLWVHIANPLWNIGLKELITSYLNYSVWLPAFRGIMVLFLFFAGLLYFSLIRRIKARTLLSSSLFGRFFILPCKRLIMHFLRNAKEFLANLSFLRKTLLLLFVAAIWLMLSVLLLFTHPVAGSIVLLLGAGICAFLCLRNMLDHSRITKGTALMSAGNLSARIPTDAMLPSNRSLSDDINQICDGLHYAVEEQTKSERMKTELITNVSHDIKTPLTSIINYIELIKNELPEEGQVAKYAEVLSQKSWRLKELIDDLVEASKAASGTIKLELIHFNALELLYQAVGDFEERLKARSLQLCMTLPDAPVNVLADGACTHRIIENMLSNVCKYALPGTRVFLSLDLPEDTGLALLTIKNTSAAILSKSPEELLTRFARGNDARSDEGSGLGLSIAESLASLQGGTFYVETDGDLFKAKLTIPLAEV